MNKINAAENFSLRIARQFKGNDINSRPFLFNEVKKIVDKDKLPANYYTSYIDLPSVGNGTVDKLKNTGITFEYLA
ncbi:hypothetical protein J6E39_00550 [bacterium]|nr:hypothetical protein [bacterium]